MKRLNGSVTVFLTMIFLLVLSVITTGIMSAKIHGGAAIISTASAMALDSVFAEYDAELFAEYGILLFEGTDEEELVKRINTYLTPTVEKQSGRTDIFGIKIEGISIKNIETAVDKGGLLWMEESISYEKYAKAINLAADYLEIGNAAEMSETLENITDKMTDVAEDAGKINNMVKELIMYIDGVEYRDTYILDECEGREYFLKKFRNDGFIDDNPALSVITADYAVKIGNELEKAYYMELEGNSSGAWEILNKFYNDAGGVLGVTENLKERLRMVKDSCTGMEGQVCELEEYIKTTGQLLGEQIVTGMINDIDDMKDYEEIIREKMCDISALTASMEYNRALLTECRDILENYTGSEDILKLKNLMENYTYDGMDINYDFYKKTGTGSNIIKNLKKIFKKGIIGMAVPEGDTVSGRYVTLSDLASSTCGTGGTEALMSECDTGTRLAKKIIYGEYVMDHFNSYTDKEEGAALNYEVEYILNGKKYDADNLYETIKKIATVRSVINMAYLLTDTEKKESAYMTAQTVFGWTGAEGLVKAGQYLVMYMWAYAEGLVEVKALLSEGKIMPVKTEENWQLSYEKFLTLDLEPEQDKCEKGMDYEMYLRALLIFQDEGKKSANTMDLVELWKIASGDTKFRLRNYVFSVEAEIMYTVSDMNRRYTYSFAESY